MKFFDAAPWGAHKLGQYNINPGSAGIQNAWNNPYSFNRTGNGLSPEQNILNAESAMPATGEVCYTCSNGSDIKNVSGADAAAALKKQGYACRKTECGQRGGDYGNLWSGISDQSQMIETTGQMQIPDSGSEGLAYQQFQAFGGDQGGGMMMGRRVRLVRGIGTRVLG